MTNVLKYWLFLLLLTSSWRVSAQEVAVSAKLDTNAMLIGDHVGVTLKFTGPAGARVLWPFLPDTMLRNITVIGRGKIDTALSADKKTVTLTQALNLTSYDSGFYTMPSIPFRYRVAPDTALKEIGSGMMLLAVHTVKVDTTKAIKPIIGPLRVPLTLREILPWVLLGLAAILLITGIFWYLRKRKKKEPVFQLKPTVVLPPHEKALHDLEALRVKKLWQNGQVKQFHSELTEILRRYIEDRFRVPALEQTSAEISESLVTVDECPDTSLDLLMRVLILADLVKFAKANPLATENEQSFSDGVEFVRSTIRGVNQKPLT